MTNKEKAIATWEMIQERKRKRLEKAQKDADAVAIGTVKRIKNRQAKNYKY